VCNPSYCYALAWTIAGLVVTYFTLSTFQKQERFTMKELLFQNDEGDVLTESELEAAHLEYLDDTYPLARIGEWEYPAGYALALVDPILYRQDFLDYLDSFGWYEVEA